MPADWAQRSCSYRIFVDLLGQGWNNFIHAINEPVMVSEGRLEISVTDQARIAEDGDEIFIPKVSAYSLKNISGSVTWWLYGYDRYQSRLLKEFVVPAGLILGPAELS